MARYYMPTESIAFHLHWCSALHKADNSFATCNYTRLPPIELSNSPAISPNIHICSTSRIALDAPIRQHIYYIYGHLGKDFYRHPWQRILNFQCADATLRAAMAAASASSFASLTASHITHACCAPFLRGST